MYECRNALTVRVWNKILDIASQLQRTLGADITMAHGKALLQKCPFCERIDALERTASQKKSKGGEKPSNTCPEMIIAPQAQLKLQTKPVAP